MLLFIPALAIPAIYTVFVGLFVLNAPSSPFGYHIDSLPSPLRFLRLRASGSESAGIEDSLFPGPTHAPYSPENVAVIPHPVLFKVPTIQAPNLAQNISPYYSWLNQLRDNDDIYIAQVHPLPRKANPNLESTFILSAPIPELRILLLGHVLCILGFLLYPIRSLGHNSLVKLNLTVNLDEAFNTCLLGCGTPNSFTCRSILINSFDVSPDSPFSAPVYTAHGCLAVDNSIKALSWIQISPSKSISIPSLSSGLSHSETSLDELEICITSEFEAPDEQANAKEEGSAGEEVFVSVRKSVIAMVVVDKPKRINSKKYTFLNPIADIPGHSLTSEHPVFFNTLPEPLQSATTPNQLSFETAQPADVVVPNSPEMKRKPTRRGGLKLRKKMANRKVQEAEVSGTTPKPDANLRAALSLITPTEASSDEALVPVVPLTLEPVLDCVEGSSNIGQISERILCNERQRGIAGVSVQKGEEHQLGIRRTLNFQQSLSVASEVPIILGANSFVRSSVDETESSEYNKADIPMLNNGSPVFGPFNIDVAMQPDCPITPPESPTSSQPMKSNIPVYIKPGNTFKPGYVRKRGCRGKKTKGNKFGHSLVSVCAKQDPNVQGVFPLNVLDPMFTGFAETRI